MADDDGVVHQHKYWNKRDAELFEGVKAKSDKRIREWEESAVKASYQVWKTYIVNLKKWEFDNKLTSQTVDILKNSIRCQRTQQEKEILKKFIINNLTCIPHEKLTSGEMDRLCNEVDWNPLVGQSILFLQGDFGNVYYMVAKGCVALYLAPSTDKEMEIAREFGHLRGHPFSGSDEDCLKFGHLIFTVSKGAGFGEFAILNATKKMRTCAAIARDDASVLMIMHAETYDAVLRKFHTRQGQLNSARSLLAELPLFSHYGFSKISAIAYTLKGLLFTNKSHIAKTGSTVNKVYLIISGEVKVISRQKRSDNQSDGTSSPRGSLSIERKLPPLAYAQIGKGCIIGELEIQKSSKTFLMDYMVMSAECEVFEMPLEEYTQCLESTANKAAHIYEKIDAIAKERDRLHQARIDRTTKAVQSMMVTTIGEIEARNTLSEVLPALFTGDQAQYQQTISSIRNNESSKFSMSTTASKLGVSPKQSQNTFGTQLSVNMNSVIETMTPRHAIPGQKAVKISLPGYTGPGSPLPASPADSKKSYVSPRKRN